MNLPKELDELGELRQIMCRLESSGGDTAAEVAGKCLGRDPMAEIEAIVFREVSGIGRRFAGR